jgi:hypothetical protein
MRDWTMPALAAVAVVLAFGSLLIFKPTFDGVIGLAITQGLSWALWLIAMRHSDTETQRRFVLPFCVPLATILCLILIWGIRTAMG